ncbi:MAG: hypothetical protein K2G46_00860 [Bacteroidales bacterium]|nr:hypothetical protein [Bacteroidales bacterium]
MKKQNLLTIWAKRAVPALALAAMVLPACEKPVEQHDEVILYYNNNLNNPKFGPDTIQKYAADKHVRNIYNSCARGDVFRFGAE